MSAERIDAPVFMAQPGFGSTPAAVQSSEAQAAKEFETVFLSQAIDEMLRTVDLGGMSGGHAEDTWRSFLAQAIADEIAGTGTTRISDGVESAIAGYRSAAELREPGDE